MSAERFDRISKAEARRRFANNETFDMCPCKLYPGGPWSSSSRVFPESYKPEGYPDLWYSFDSMEANWSYYNASREAGYYAHYYIAT